MKILPFISLFFIMLLATSATAASVTPEKYQVTECMNNYDLRGENNSYNLACEIGQFVSEEYGWNCDIREVTFENHTHTPIYLNVFYPAANNKKGYEAYYGWFGPQKKEVVSFWTRDQNENVVMYYKNWDSESNTGCRITRVRGSPIVKSYFGNVTEEDTTDPVVIPEENDTTDPIEEVVNNTTEEVTNDSGFEMNIYNETTGAVVDIAAEIPGKVSEEGQKDYLEAVKHFFNAVFGWRL